MQSRLSLLSMYLAVVLVTGFTFSFISSQLPTPFGKETRAAKEQAIPGRYTFPEDVPQTGHQRAAGPVETYLHSSASFSKLLTPGFASPFKPEGNSLLAEQVLPLDRDAGKEKIWSDELVELISFLQSPLPGTQVSTKDSHLPGAPRPYREGKHEGLDYYGGYIGRELNFGEPVYSAGPGIVMRIDHAYSELDPDEREKMLQACSELGKTPEHILDKLRGRQVWVLHPYGIVTRYAHLDQVAGSLQEGQRIESGEFIGTIGNSGTGDGTRENECNPHLHFEVWVGDYYLGKGLDPDDTRALLEEVLY